MQCRKLALMRQMHYNMNQKDKDEERTEQAYLSDSQGYANLSLSSNYT
jgi:hypothetical protein